MASARLSVWARRVATLPPLARSWTSRLAHATPHRALLLHARGGRLVGAGVLGVAGAAGVSSLAGAQGPALTWEVLARQDDTTTNAILAHLANDPLFAKVSNAETQSILDRDAEDDEKLERGIKIAVDKGVLKANVKVEPVRKIDVLGLSADDLAAKVLSLLPNDDKGKVIVFQGLSGTGKGTLVSKLKQRLPNAVTWSNGNMFRALTLLAVTYCEQQGIAFSEDVLTPERLAAFVSMLEFGKFNGKFDIKIEGLGLNMLVSDVELTELKSAKVGKNIPTVAKLTQGEVVVFANNAVALMGKAGLNVLVEGREATLNHVRSPHRFELTLSDTQLIGKRRCAQKIMGLLLKSPHSAKHLQGGGGGGASSAGLSAAVSSALADVAASWGL